MELSETLDKILPSGWFEWDSLHCLPVGVEPAVESPIAASKPTGEDVVPEESAAPPMDVIDDVVQEFDIEESVKRIQVKHLKLDDYLKKTFLLNLDQMEDYNHPLRDVSENHVARLLRWFQGNGLDTIMGRISLHLNPLKNKAHGPQTELFNKGKTLPVLKNTLTVHVVDGHHRFTALCQL